MAQTVIGIFRDADKAQQAVDQLLSNGFSESNVDLSSQRLTETNRHDHQESGIARFFRNLFDKRQKAGKKPAYNRFTGLRCKA